MNNEEISVNASKALLLYQQAQSKLNPGCCQAIFSSASDRIDEAFELILEAAKLYKLDKKYADSAKCYVECGELKQANKEPHIEFYEESLLLYMKIKDTSKYKDLLAKCINAAVASGKFLQAANYAYENAINLEDEGKTGEAIDSYELAIDYFEKDKDSRNATINHCKVKRADLLCITNDSRGKEEARAIYEEVGRDWMNTSSTSQQAKDLFGKCVICYLVYDDYISARAFLHKFYEVDYAFKGSSLGELLEELIIALEESSLEKYTKAIAEFRKGNKKAWDSSDWLKIMTTKIEEKIKTSEVHNENFAAEEDFK